MKAIFHFCEFEKFDHCYLNINNLLKESEVEETRVLINGEAAKLTVQGVEKRMQELLHLGIFITVCQNSLDSNEIDNKELLKGVEVVTTGVFELMKRQEQGYSYIRV